MAFPGTSTYPGASTYPDADAPTPVTSTTSGAYGSGTYSDGDYNVGTIPATGGGGGGGTSSVYPGPATYPGAGVYPGGIADTTTTGYGSGTYSGGEYVGVYVPPQDDGGTANAGYGAGNYSAGPYLGGKPTVPYAGLWGDTAAAGNPLHLLGIGPYNTSKTWRGAANYGITGGNGAARPHLQLPAVQSKSFTLRLNDGSEASASLQFAPHDVVIVDRMSTDLWWRRKDPRTQHLDMLGRFNTNTNDMSRNADGTITSDLQFVDYYTILGQRMVLKYLTTNYASDGKTVDSQSSIWNTGTPITQIMRFAVPTDTGIDLSILNDDTLLGNATQPFTLPPYNTIADTFTSLNAISAKTWEWWVETPSDVTQPPRLMFAIGQRGANKGVSLVDYGTGPSPIASWTMRHTSDTYANALYFQGGAGAGASNSGGGVITTIPSQIADYGERDAQDSDSSIAGDINAIMAGARKKLVTLSDLRPTFTIRLAPGFWRGTSHIGVGDTIHLRLTLGNELFDYDYRVTEIAGEIDDTGNETITLTLGNPLPSANPRSRYSPVMKVIRKLKNYVAPAGSTTIDTSS